LSGTAGSIWGIGPEYNSFMVFYDTWNWLIIFPGFRIRIWNSSTAVGTTAPASNFDRSNNTSFPVVYRLSDYGGADYNDMYEVTRL
jgi:hypothetical protein